MRLRVLESGHSFVQKVRLALMRWRGFHPNDMTKMMCYRRGFFGGHLYRLYLSVMRDKSVWTHGERQLFASFVSAQNQCVF